ncbi:UDP-N-acetylglucosamine 2-epimerase (hydrolyzing) [Pedobacter aquae]|uniref:UDP-N-acetylglucosamine 2-epimerase (Hydrolyzing) n=1 Tax=Pedobacter aquae TaxID=2605747 RepID=A0A5C0VHQ3_9SPHI|nr:UDP-N-acetylglucosamine 2-epimerase [Pedobacter aquae]QEK52218.1 UDP-N-acetylglucosamine 2-epimerase (hydrolyzing) [Pedobacter aquae]
MKVCIVTGTRAEYGLLKPLIDSFAQDERFQLQLCVTGAHLSPEFGLTYQQIIQDGYQQIEKVEMLLSSDSAVGITKSMGLALIGFADVLERLKPDVLVILGDRYEMLAVASAALIFKIPIAHLHGGELTEGAYDDAIRHAITKMSSLHFTSTEAYRQRVIQLGENPQHVHHVGAIGLDNIKNLNLLSLAALQEQLQVKFLEYNYLITFHPETHAKIGVEAQFQELLKALDTQADSLFIFTKANADTHGRTINQMIDDYVSKNPQKAIAFTSMGQLRYLSAMKYCTAVIGNSSSGIIEAPSFHKPSINIGDRQKGRVQASSVINVNASTSEIVVAINNIKLSKENFNNINPYGDGHTAEKIVKIIAETSLAHLLPKPFYNLHHV